jgi:hypothetical protein
MPACRVASRMISLMGAVLALYAFMADALSVLRDGPSAVRGVLPASFNWPVFGIAMLLMAGPLLDMLWNLKKNPATVKELEQRESVLV